ncbi:MAG: endonuclease/exonuclease/phosphatase family protein [Candidatus Paceibacterota bacterium]|jgi:exonuclease III
MNFSILDWNIQGTKYYTSTNLKKIIPYLEKSKADIFCLQEAQELREKIQIFSKLREFNRVFSKDVHNRNIILSKFPIISSGELIFPQFKRTPLERALWADIEIEGKIIRIYNCHFEIVGVGPKERINQLKFVLEHSKQYREPVIICGDMNTTIPSFGIKRKIVQWFHKESNESLLLDGKHFYSDERYVFFDVAKQEGFCEAIDILKTTWCIPPFGWEIFKLKLDWFLVRGIKMPNIHLGNYISDHRSVFAEWSDN